MLDNPSRHAAMASEMQSIVRLAAEPVEVGDTVKAQITRSARRLSLPWRRAKTFWHAEKCAIRAEEADHLRAESVRILRERLARLAVEQDVLRGRLNELDKKYASPDSDLLGNMAVGCR